MSTARAAVSAYDLASVPIQVTRGSRQNTMPPSAATRVEVNFRARTTVREAATPTAIALGRRTSTGEYPKMSTRAWMTK